MVADDSLGHVSLDPSTQQSFDLRWEHYLPDLWIGLSRVYGDRADETPVSYTHLTLPTKA